MKKKKVKIFITKVLFVILALILIPLLTILIINLKVLFEGYDIFNPEIMFIIIGFIGYLGFFIMAGPPKKTYVLQHELTHAIGALISGVRIKEFRISKGTGYIKTERVNVFIALLPYVFPLYCFLIVFLFYILSILMSLGKIEYIFYFLIGLSLSFHTSATFYYLLIDQPDLRRYGIFSSTILILIWYVIVISMLLYLLIPQINIKGFYEKSFDDYFMFYKYLIYKIFLDS